MRDGVGRREEREDRKEGNIKNGRRGERKHKKRDSLFHLSAFQLPDTYSWNGALGA